MTEASPLRGRRIVEVLATSAGGVGTHVRTLVPAIARGRRDGAASAGRPPPRSCSASPPPAPTSGRSASPPGWRRSPTAGAVRAAPPARPPAPTWCTPTACAPAWSPRPPAGWRGSAARPLVLTLHNALQESSGPRQRLLRAVEAADDPRRRPRARRLQRPGRQRPPARAPATSGSRRRSPRRCRPRPHARRGARRARASTTAGRCSSRSAGCTRRRATTCCSTPSRGGSATAGCSRRRWSRSPATGRWSDELAERIARRAAAGPAARAADRRRRPARCGRRVRAALALGGQPVHRPGGAARRHARWSPPAPAASPSWSGTGAELVPVGDAAALADAVVRVLGDPAHAAAAGRGGPPAGGRRGRTRRPPAGGWSPSTGSCSAPPGDGP